MTVVLQKARHHLRYRPSVKVVPQLDDDEPHSEADNSDRDVKLKVRLALEREVLVWRNKSPFVNVGICLLTTKNSQERDYMQGRPHTFGHRV